MGKISETLGNCCAVCECYKNKDYEGCLECYSQFLFQTDELACPDCLKPRANNKYVRCFDCHTMRENGDFHLEDLHTITYEIKQDIGYALHAYKGSGVPLRQHMIFPLQSLVRAYLIKHWRCFIKRYRGVEAIVVVPSKPRILLRALPKEIRALIVPEALVEVNPHGSYSAGAGERRFDPARYKVPHEQINRISGGTVLLFDDVYTSGSTIHSAAYALKEAGAYEVVGLVVGRHVRSEERIAELITEQERNPFNIAVCKICKPV